MYYSSYWPSREGLRIGHLNICHLINKIDDIANILYNRAHPFHVFGITKSHLSDLIPDSELNISGYSLIRRDANVKLENGIIVYVSNSLHYYRKHELENHGVESVWIEVKLKNVAPLPIGIIYKNLK